MLGRFADSLAALRRISDRYRDDPAPELRALVVAGLLNEGITLGVMGKSRDAANTYRQLIDSHGGDPTLHVLVERAEALLSELADDAGVD
jgi:hypothetical protein